MKHGSSLTLCMARSVCSVVSISLSTIISEALLKLSHFSGLLYFCFQLFLVSVPGICTGDSIGPCNNLLASFHFKLMTTAGSARYIQLLEEHFSGDIYRALGMGRQLFVVTTRSQA